MFGAAHDHDARASLPLLTNPRDRWAHVRALRGARAVIAQTEFQQRLFRDEFGVHSTLVPNLVETPAAPADAGQDGAVVWLATYKAAKRPAWFVNLARALPRQRFVMCGVIPIPPETNAEWEAARAAARELSNLEVRGYVDHERLGELFRGASLFVHTSPVEGFPNTVLEAWAHGVPTVTAVDPDGVVLREGLGAIARGEAELRETVRALMADPGRRRALGAKARAHVASRHSAEVVFARLCAVFDDALARGG